MAANEIVKAEDFVFANDQSINNIETVIGAILTSPQQDIVIGGLVKPYSSGGMNVSVDPIFAHSGVNDVDVVETLIQQPISIEPSSQNQNRIDIIQVRGVEEQYDKQNRRFRDPKTGSETVERIDTKKRVKLDVKVKRGENGNVTAPLADQGYVKLAEIIIPSGTFEIGIENIFNISARCKGEENANWTNQKARAFNPGYLTDIMEKFLVSHGEDGKIKDKNVLASMILFGSGQNGVNGSMIPVGSSMDIAGTEHGIGKTISGVMEALAAAVNNAYPFANNLLSRYVLLPDAPVAASTGNIDIVTGGEITIDGVECSDGQLVLLKDQDNPKDNGFWKVKSGKWERYAGYTSANESVFNGKFAYVKSGTANKGKIFYMDRNAAVGTDALVFIESVFSPDNLPGKVPVRDIGGAINSPVFTGTPKVPSKTAAAANDGTLIATEAQVALLANLVFPVGIGIQVGPNDATPTERGLPGNWEDWTQRAEVYGLFTTNGSAYRTYSSSLTNVIAGEYIRWTMPNTGHYMVVRAKAAMATVPSELNPIDWWFPEDVPITNGAARYGRTLIYVRSRATPNFSWTAADKAFNNSFTGNSTTMPGTSSTTYYVHEKITWAGKFPSFDGGNRPTFVSGGVQQGRVVNHRHEFETVVINGGNSANYIRAMSVTVHGVPSGNTNFLDNFISSPLGVYDALTGTENSVLTLSEKLYRRIS
jgi:hypothetical protein